MYANGRFADSNRTSPKVRKGPEGDIRGRSSGGTRTDGVSPIWQPRLRDRASAGLRWRQIERNRIAAGWGWLLVGSNRPNYIERAKSRRCAMNRATAGLSVRPFNVKIANRKGRTGTSTGNIFTSDWEASSFGIAPMNRPLATRWVRSGTERVSTAIIGMASSRARNAPAMNS